MQFSLPQLFFGYKIKIKIKISTTRKKSYLHFVPIERKNEIPKPEIDFKGDKKRFQI
jgi:hypothetical protein